MLITMLNDVCPQDYDIKGQPGWREEVQWKKGETYNLDLHTAGMFMENGDAYNAEDEDEVIRAAAERAEQKDILGKDTEQKPDMAKILLDSLNMDAFAKMMKDGL